MTEKTEQNTPPVKQDNREDTPSSPSQKSPKEIGGYDGKNPTEYGDWQHNGRCTDF